MKNCLLQVVNLKSGQSDLLSIVAVSNPNVAKAWLAHEIYVSIIQFDKIQKLRSRLLVEFTSLQSIICYVIFSRIGILTAGLKRAGNRSEPWEQILRN